jgi:RNA polymerase sigma factor (sigma-70 family)
MLSNIANGYIAPLYAYIYPSKMKPWACKLCTVFSKKFIEIWPFEICNIINHRKLKIGNLNNSDYTYDQIAPEFCSIFTLTNSETENENKIIDTMMINKYLINLSKKEKEVIIRHICYSDTLESIGESFGFTRERIRQIYNIGMKKIQRSYLKFKELENLID